MHNVSTYLYHFYEGSCRNCCMATSKKSFPANNGS